MSRLAEVYRKYEVKRLVPQKVYIADQGKLMQKGDVWGRDFCCATFTFHAEGVKEGERYCLYALTGATEHLVTVNGKKVGMLDYVPHAAAPQERVHKYLPIEVRNGDEVALEGYYSHPFPGTMPYDEYSTFALDGLYPRRRYEGIWLCEMDDGVCNLCNMLELLNKRFLAEEGFARAQTEKVYEKLFEILPLAPQRPDEQSVQSATAVIADYMSKPPRLPFVGLIGHSHLDTAWLWTVEETRRKLMRTLSNAVTLLEKYHDYKFILSTVLYLKWVEEDDPDLFERVKKLVAQGRLEPNGCSWVECDGNLTGGEAFCRQLLWGKRYLWQKFNYVPDAFWLPDTFGYSPSLPQLMVKSGLKYFLTTKLSWNDTNRFPYETFVWQGIDGSRVTVHFNTIHTAADQLAVQKRLQNVADKGESDRVLIAYGYGDGGGGPSEEMVKQALHTQRNCKFAEVKHVTVSEFMQGLQNADLPLYHGELYLELHRGTYTVNSLIKKLNRKLECALHDAELVSVLCGDGEGKKLTDKLYSVLLLNQFHDVLPGTCIRQVNTEAEKQLAQALKEAYKYVGGSGKKRYFNTLGWQRTEVLPSAKGQNYVAVDGKQRTVARFKFDAYGYGKKINAPAAFSFSFDGRRVVTPFLTAEVKEGVITSLAYKGKQYVNGGFNLLRYAENVPYIYDNWDIDADYVLKEKSAEFVRQSLVACGESILVLRAEYRLGEDELYTDVKFYAHTPMVEMENRLVTKNKHSVIRAYFDTTLFAPRYKCETQFGSVERNAYPHDVTDEAKFEVCAHKWTDLSQNDCGLSLLTDCKYGVSVSGGTMGLTLHKGGTHPDDRGGVGESYFRYALLPHEGALGIETIKAAYNFNFTPLPTARKMHGLFVLHGDGVICETVKQGEDGGVVVRLYECLGGDACVSIQCPYEIYSCTLTEEQPVFLAASEARLQFAPFEIKTLLLKPLKG